MLSLEQIKSVTFDRAVRGYRPEDVDDFVSQIASQMEKLIEEKQNLENKLYVLAESVEKYRDDEDALKSALINAQKLGESVISEANKKAEEILRESKAKADREYNKVLDDINSEYTRLTKMQHEVTRFRSTVLALYKSHIELLSDLPHEEQQEAAEFTSEGSTGTEIAAITETVTEITQTNENATTEPEGTNVVAPPQVDAATSVFDVNKSEPQPANNLYANQPPAYNENQNTNSKPILDIPSVYPPAPKSEVEPIIPMMDEYEKAQSERNAAEQGSGRISLFNHYSDYNTDDDE